MKTLKLSAACMAALAGMAAWSSIAGAQEPQFQPYIGFDLQRNHVSYADDSVGGVSFNWGEGLEDNLDGLNIHVGNRFNKHVGLELGYFRTKEESKTFDLLPATPVTSKVMLQGVTLDALGYIPVTPNDKLELIGTAGVSYSWVDVELDTGALGLGTLKDDEGEFGFRAGAGAQFNITDNLNVRGLARYQSADFDGVADNIWVYTVGLNYSF
ncbi:MAG: porin family protein [Alphaproteobacteria bacterium]|nr:porin family protein [Alphaproteobacteria bacterium]